MGSVRLYGATSGYVELQAPDVSPDAALVLPSDSLQAGLVHLHTETFSAQSTVSIDDVFSGSYQNYKICLDINRSTTASIRFQFRSSGSPLSTNYYSSSAQLRPDSDSFRWTRVNNGSYGSSYSGAADFVSSADIMRPFEFDEPTVLFGDSYQSNNAVAGPYMVIHNPNSQNDGISVYPSAGTITGTIRIYAYRNN